MSNRDAASTSSATRIWYVSPATAVNTAARRSPEATQSTSDSESADVPRYTVMPGPQSNIASALTDRVRSGVNRNHTDRSASGSQLGATSCGLGRGHGQVAGVLPGHGGRRGRREVVVLRRMGTVVKPTVRSLWLYCWASMTW